jgi:hypothetical protein
MNPAEELRAAAAKIRALATAASEDSGSSHWETIRVHPEYPESTSTRLRANPGGLLIHGGGYGKRPGPRVSGPVGDYIAAMEPAVGLVLADLLDDQAAGDDEGVINPWALAVARQILGTTP